ncbi:CBS domain-containing protein [Aeromicrobium sp. SMF47]|uniref:CBS domain-containing protein n=1 Tax=Aeromicrobium yanjiei TaxID=2662028 RepID=A0A5Q2MC58_9ACTN|nr:MULTISPECIES: CBS domain-containing protein [Aeromicrobium]MRJ78272.1 CBS domain-containing protein [Aeromicrobium yanjiei]MRK03098.1 CBS domain-containing protein [Aeromicrobium sp. S22]QGG40667.1 CBS domain-containing protein [Aeromicrobium yanjiei]
MRVKDVLSSKGSDAVHVIAPDATVSDLMDRLADLNVGALIVSTDGSEVLGIVSERDIVRKLRGAENARDVAVSAIMTTDVRTCSPEDSFGGLMAIMTEHRVRHVPVLEDGRLVGVLSIGDAVKHRMEQLEFERDQLNSYVAGG